MTSPSMRHPHVSLEDTIAMKMAILSEPSTMPHDARVKLAKEIIGDLTEFILTEREKPPPPLRLQAGDILTDVWSAGTSRGESIVITHTPTNIAVRRDGVTSLLMAKAEMFVELEALLKEQGWQPPR